VTQALRIAVLTYLTSCMSQCKAQRCLHIHTRQMRLFVRDGTLAIFVHHGAHVHAVC
jgi:hypothetical protein